MKLRIYEDTGFACIRSAYKPLITENTKQDCPLARFKWESARQYFPPPPEDLLVTKVMPDFMGDSVVDEQKVDESLLEWARKNLNGIPDDAQYAHMISGIMYDPFVERYEAARLRTSDIAYEFKNTRLSSFSSPGELIRHQQGVLKKLLGRCGDNCYFDPPFHVSYGFNLSVGDNVQAKVNALFEDSSIIRIGNGVSLGPNAQISTVTRRIEPDGKEIEYALPIVIGNNVWIGASCSISGGVTIGDNAVIVSGSIVSEDVPPNSVFRK